MIAGSTERVTSRRFRTVRVVVSSLSTVARSMGASPLHRPQARAGLVVDTAQGIWQHSIRKRQRAQSQGGTASSSPQHCSVETVHVHFSTEKGNRWGEQEWSLRHTCRIRGGRRFRCWSKQWHTCAKARGLLCAGSHSMHSYQCPLPWDQVRRAYEESRTTQR